MIRIGLTGGIAAGKSTVAAHLHELGAFLIDYDLLARRVVEPGGGAVRRIAEAFGRDVVLPDGSLDRRRLADLVFGQGAGGAARNRLDAIEHPLIYRAAQDMERDFSAAAGTSDVVVHDIPLLAEVVGDLPFGFDHVVTVEAPVEVRVRRMMDTRAMSRAQALGRVNSQPGEGRRRAVADVVIDATQSIEQMFDRVDRLYAQWQRESLR